MSKEKQVWMPFVNGTDETIPPMACVVITGKEASSGNRTVPKVELTPENGFGAQFLHRITWEQEVEPGKTGQMCFPLFAPIMAAFDPGDGTPAAGAMWGPIGDGPKLRKHVGGYRVLGKPVRGARNDYAVLVQAEPFLGMAGQLTEQLATNSSALCISSYASDEFEFYATEKMGLTEPIPAQTNVWLSWDTYYKSWVVTAAACGSGTA